MRDYLLPGIKDAPATIRTMFVDNDDETGPFGAKGVAEASSHSGSGRGCGGVA